MKAGYTSNTTHGCDRLDTAGYAAYALVLWDIVEEDGQVFFVLLLSHTYHLEKGHLEYQDRNKHSYSRI